MTKYAHGFAVIGAQPYHIGHDRLVKAMLRDCQNVTVVISSAQASGTKDNPWPYHVRKKMIQNVYRGTVEYERLRIIGVDDVDNVLQWPKAVLDKIASERPDIPPVDVFYAGTIQDYDWFKPYIAQFEICDRTSQNFPFLSGGMVREMISYHDERWRDFVHEVNYDLILKK